MPAEHAIYSVPPERRSQSGYCICKGWNSLAIPRHIGNLLPGLLVLQIPQPYHRIQPKTQCRGTFGPLALEGLNLLAAQKLFGILESIFDRPSAGESGDHLFAFHCQVGTDKRIWRPFVVRIASNDHQQRLFAYMIPDDLLGEDEHGSVVHAFCDEHFLPLPYSLCQETGFFQSISPNASSSPSSWRLCFGQIENDGVFSHVRDYVHMSRTLAYQSRVKAVAMANKAPFGQPGFDLMQHLESQLNMAWATFDSQTHIDWQADGFAFPRRNYSQCYHHQVQPTRESGKHIRKDGVSPFGCSLNVFAGSSKEGIVHIEIDPPFWTERLYQQYGHGLPKTGQFPACFVEESMKGVVGLCEKLRREGYDARNGASGRAQDPATDQGGEDAGCGSCKNREKVFENLIPCRCNSGIHTDLHVLIFLLSKTSESQYVRAYYSLFSFTTVPLRIEYVTITLAMINN